MRTVGHVVDLPTVDPAELDHLWAREVRLWQERLRWDVADVFAALRRMMGRRSLPGKVIWLGGRAMGYVYYVIAGDRGMLSSPIMVPESANVEMTEQLLQEAIADMRAKGVRRIESPFVSIDCPWLAPAFERQGFRTYWRDFLRVDLPCSPAYVKPGAMAPIEPWQAMHLDAAASTMQAAYEGSVDVEIYAEYGTVEGCCVVLDNLLNQASCGSPVLEASAVARQRGLTVGFIAVTEIARAQAHLAQVAVLPLYQHRGLGRGLVDYAVSRLATAQFEALSLIVSRGNERALRLYESMGFQAVLTFPAFTWERERGA
jgi:ribosomal protein S18 acetylase RimI-like enzyme